MSAPDPILTRLEETYRYWHAWCKRLNLQRRSILNHQTWRLADEQRHQADQAIRAYLLHGKVDADV